MVPGLKRSKSIAGTVDKLLAPYFGIGIIVAPVKITAFGRFVNPVDQPQNAFRRFKRIGPGDRSFGNRIEQLVGIARGQ
ncbi:hypothetical protein D3C87_2135310 [compost metagenome]